MSTEEPPAVNVEFDINKVAAEVIFSAAAESVRRAGSVLKTTTNALSDLFTRIYKDYLIHTYRRVSTIKTFINPQVPIDLYENFISLNLKCNGNQIDETELIQLVKNGSRLVISALAGRGKSVLMKYIALTR